MPGAPQTKTGRTTATCSSRPGSWAGVTVIEECMSRKYDDHRRTAQVLIVAVGGCRSAYRDNLARAKQHAGSAARRALRSFHQVAVQVNVGAGLVPLHEPRNPNLVLPLAGNAPFQAALPTITCGPGACSAAFHRLVTVCPAA